MIMVSNLRFWLHWQKHAPPIDLDQMPQRNASVVMQELHMKPTIIPAMSAVVVCMLFVAYSGLGLAQDPDKALHDWQVQRLMEPSPRDLEKEHRGYVYIYDGLTEREVDTALNTQFPRIQNMMFVGTVKTDTRGEPLQDAESGQPIQESGGCGN
jgi:hypothetical protein